MKAVAFFACILLSLTGFSAHASTLRFDITGSFSLRNPSVSSQYGYGIEFPFDLQLSVFLNKDVQPILVLDATTQSSDINWSNKHWKSKTPIYFYDSNAMRSIKHNIGNAIFEKIP
jgi:hypothetical protein